MEAFLLGDKGPEVFYEVQDTVVDTIQEKYYHSFLLSDQYTALIAELATEEANKGIKLRITHAHFVSDQFLEKKKNIFTSLLTFLHYCVDLVSKHINKLSRISSALLHD